MTHKSFSSLVQAFIYVSVTIIFSASTTLAENIQIYNNDHKNRNIISYNSSFGNTSSLVFGENLLKTLEFNHIDNIFNFTNTVDFSNNEIQNVKIENNTTANKICNSTYSGEIFYNTNDKISYVCSGTEWRILENSALAPTTGLKPYFESINTTTFATNETKDVIVTGGNFTVNTVFSLSTGATLNSYSVTSDNSAILNITAGAISTTVNIESPTFFGNTLFFIIQ